MINNTLCSEKSLSGEKILPCVPKKQFRLAVIGGSNSVMRKGYTKYLQEYIDNKTDNSLELSYFSMGGVTSFFGAIQNCRHDISKNHDVILFEYCVNDRGACINGKYTPRMAGIALEGFIRQAKSMNPKCIIIIIIFGTNLPSFYDNWCYISAVYESIARRYKIPVVNITEILLQNRGINFIKQLYTKNDCAHYARPQGAKLVGEVIAQQIITRQIFQTQPKPLKQCYRIYPGNIQGLKFFSDFDALENQNQIKKTTFKNHLFEEEIHTIAHPSSINLKLKGRLLGIMIKSDWYDGLIKIRLGSQELIASSFSQWVVEEGKSNINLLNLPYQKFDGCNEFENLSISVCHKEYENYELDLCKKKPVVSPQEWKLNIIGIAYLGEISLEN